MRGTISLCSSLSWKSSKTSGNSVAITSEYLVKILSAQVIFNYNNIPSILYILLVKVYDVAIETPLTYAANLSNLLGNEVYLKREDTQPVFSFKIRGAYNKIAHLTDHQKRNGVVTCSAGNHAQGVALSAAKLGIKAIIVMPEATPKIKVSAVER